APGSGWPSRSGGITATTPRATVRAAASDQSSRRKSSRSSYCLAVPKREPPPAATTTARTGDVWAWGGGSGKGFVELLRGLLLDLLVVDHLAEADLLGVVDRDHQREVAVGEAEHEVLPVLAENLTLLTLLDHGGAVMGVDDLVTDVEGHAAPERETNGSTSRVPASGPLRQLARRRSDRPLLRSSTK